jgi:DNA-binding Lrp family transcriptional regulator
MDERLDNTDRAILNALQGGFPIVARPFAAVADELGLDEATLIERVQTLLDRGVASRFGPLFNAEAMGGAFTLAALAVPEDRFADVAALVNAHPEVAHNYRRGHDFNMWFVVACEQPERIAEVLREIERETGLPVIDLPKEEEFFLELKLTA